MEKPFYIDITMRFFYIDIRNVPPSNVASYMDSTKKALAIGENPYINAAKMIHEWEDYFLPIMSDSKVEIKKAKIKT